MIVSAKHYLTEEEYNALKGVSHKEINNWLEAHLPDYIIYGYGFYGFNHFGFDEKRQSHYADYTTSNNCE